MNFFKRAGLSLTARKAKSLLMLGLFLVIFTLVLGGFLLRNATGQSAANAKASVGADVTLEWDFEKAMAKANGGMPPPPTDKDRLDVNKVDKLGQSPLVRDYNYTMESATAPQKDLKLIESSVKQPEGLQMATASPGGGTGPPDMNHLSVSGVRDSALTDEFKKGRHTVIDGRRIAPSDADKKVVMVEERLAAKNGLKVGGKLAVTTPDGKNATDFEIVGIYRDPTAPSQQWMPPSMLPGNKLYAPAAAMAALNPTEGGLHLAKYTLKDPGKFGQFKQQAQQAGIDLGIFKLDNNDKLYRDMIGPIQNIASSATVAVWLVSIAGAAILGLIVAMAIKERRQELGILLSLGEKKWKLIGQHFVEVVAVAVLALGGSVLIGQLLAQHAGKAMLDKEVAANKQNESENKTGGMMAVRIGSGPVEAPKPIDKIDVRLQAADVGRVAGVGLGIALVAILIPGVGILKLNPRNILMKGE